MLRYIPDFILEQCQQSQYNGSFDGVVLFVDIADFTSLSNNFRRQGKNGAEALRHYLGAALSQPIQIVENQGGFISHFAGDAFFAVFPRLEAGKLKIVHQTIESYYANNTVCHTEIGDFPIRVHLALSHGQIDWTIFTNEKQNEYLFSGQAINEIKHLLGQKEDRAYSPAVAAMLASAGISSDLPADKATECPLEIYRAFVNHLYHTEKPDNEIRDGAYCFLDLSRIKQERLTEAIACFQDKLEQYGGFLNKLDAGDKGLVALVLFGLPRAMGSTLDRACRFALESIAEYPELSIGLSCGNAYAGFIGSDSTKEYTALGSAVNLASRLMQKAVPGEILTDSYLEQELHYKYRFEPAAAVYLKGFSSKVHSNRLLEKLPSPQQVFLSELVGRDAELNLIQETVQTPGSSILYISGEPGLGKSRLIIEALKPYPHYFLFCEPSGHKHLEPIKQFLRQYFSLDPLLSKEQNLKSFRTHWSKLAGEDQELQRIESIVGELLGFEWEGSIWSVLPPQERPEQQRNAFTTFMSRISRDERIVIHLDDPQWLDSTDMEYFRQLGTARLENIVILAACRYFEDGSPVNLDIPNWTARHWDLDRLGPEAAELLILQHLRVESLPPETLDWIVKKADGNPLFIEQVVAYLRENQCLDRNNKIKGNLDYLSSFGIADIIGSRIDSLTENVRNTLQHACVLGLEFNTRVLSEMLSRQLDDDLGQGKHARIWADVDELRYIFTHVLIKDTAYNRMLSDKLKKLHLLAAETMERLYQNDEKALSEHAAEIAEHFERAGILDKAWHYYLSAGQDYRDKFAFEQADLNLTKALQISKQFYGEHSEQVADTLFQIREQHFAKGEYSLSSEACEEALELYSATIGTDNEKYIVALISNFFSLIKLGELERSYEFLSQAEAICLKVSDHTTELSIRVLYNKAIYYNAQGKYMEAIEILIRVIEEDHNLGVSETVTAVKHLSDLAVNYGHLGQLDKAEELFLQAYDLMCKMFGDKHPNSMMILHNLGVLARMKGHLSQAEKYAKQGMEVLKEIYGPNHPETWDAIAQYANDLYFQQRYDECIPLMRQVLDVERRLDNKISISATLSDLGNMLTSIENYDEGIACYLESIEIKKKMLGEDHIKIAWSLNNLGMTYYVMGEFEKALSTYNEVYEMLYRLYGDQNHEIGKTEYLIACALKKLKRFAEAEEHYLHSIKIYEDTVGADSALIVPALINYSSFLDVVKRLDEAIAFLLRAYNIIDKEGDVCEHEHYMDIVEGLVNLYTKSGLLSEAEKFAAMMKQTDDLETQ